MVTPLASIKNLLFDWDGALADSAALGLRAFQLAFEDLDFPFPMDGRISSLNHWLSFRATSDTMEPLAKKSRLPIPLRLCDFAGLFR